MCWAIIDSNIHGKDFTFLKHLAFFTFIMTSTTSFLHRVHVALISVSLTLLCLSPVHISPFNSRVLFESAWKKKLNSSALKISYNLYPDNIVGTSVFFQYAVIYGLHDFASLDSLKPLSPNPTKWSNTLKQFVGNLTTNCLSVFDHFVGLVLKGLNVTLYRAFHLS